MIITVHVSMSDIAQGRRKASDGCPVGRALRRAGFKQPIVSSRVIYWDGFEACVDHPPGVSDFIVRFDRGRPVRPFSFDIYLSN